VLDQRVFDQLRSLVDQLEALAVVEGLRSVGEHYGHFEQLDDQDVLALLNRPGPATTPEGSAGNEGLAGNEGSAGSFAG
jgi:predicted phosphoribosyltransferase